MPTYQYEALDKGGKQVKGVIDAGSEEIILQKLRDMGYYPLKVTHKKSKASDMDILALPIVRRIFHRIKRKHITSFTRQLATLIDAGLPILRSLSILQEQVESVLFKEAIGNIAKDIEGGSSLSEAFAKYPKQFDTLYVNMVHAGEIGGVIEGVLLKIAQYLEKSAQLRSKIRSAMMYPVAVIFITVIIVSLILVFVIPQFKDFFDQLGAELPALTQALLTASDIAQQRWYLVILGVVVFIVLYKQINKTKSGKFAFDTFKLKLPVFGSLLKKLAISRFSSTLATLITSGVPILQALDIVKDTSGNEIVARAMVKVHNSVKEGDTIHEPLAECDVFPPLVIHMVAVGEETGAIDQMLNKVAETYDREVDDTVNALTSLLEPVLIVFLGVVIGTIVVALYMPIFQISQAIK